jgi:hypothetical protein
LDSCYSKSYPPSTQYHNWKAIYNAAGIWCNKVTHQNHGQVQQWFSDLGCPLDTIERFIGYAGMGQKQMNLRQKDSYLHTPHVQPVCGAAYGGLNHLDPWSSQALLGHWTLSWWIRTFMSLAVSYELKKIEIRFHMYLNHDIHMKMCLFQVRGCLLSLRGELDRL